MAHYTLLIASSAPALVAGLAAAAGCQLAASCDIVLATEHSTFSTPGADVGLFCSTPGIAVSRSANLKMAAYMVLTGRSITANEALVAGLITRVVQNDSELQSETDAVLQSILAKSRSVIALGKKFFYRQIELDLPTAYSQGSCTMVDNLQLKDGQEGIKAFIGKRKPAWSHSSE
ncbi:Enoyl-CoA hydratase domain-containing protein 3, mitochondrial [Tyrophagus putrescentiae]|nr:Enoyl-CoA hydratase domain-containing protein 3, mitochondrial [Tyrophagus putrescentiae]